METHVPTAQSDIPAPMLVDWPLLSNAVACHESPEAWWLMQPDRCCVVLEERGAPDSAAELEALCGWLTKLPCPVIALAPDSARSPLLCACDARTASREEVALIARNISRSPRAALTLVQVLRVCEGLPMERALVVESLAYAALQDGSEFHRWRNSYKKPPRVIENGESVCLERDAGRLSIRLNRPQARNALNAVMRDALVEAFDLVQADRTISAVTVSGIGRCYSVGGDLCEFGERSDASAAHQIRSLRNPALALLRCAQRVEFRVHSACIGSGIELAAFGRRVSARGDSYFQLPELQLGLIPGSGGCVSLPKRIGRQRTAWLALSGRRLKADRALEWGLVDEILA
jgi:hypothetical protein